MPVVFPNGAPAATLPPATPQVPAAAAAGGVVQWFKKGAAAAAEIKKYEQEIAQKAEDNARLQRFFLKDGEEERITFVDGNLLPDGFIETFTFREHHLKGADGKWGNFFVCVAEQEALCPICLDGHQDSVSLSGALTIVSHKVIPSTKYPGKVYKWQRRLYVGKKDTLKKLQTLAEKYGGLAGCTFDVKRIGATAPRVGSDFFYVQKNTPEELMQTFVTDVHDLQTGQSKQICTYQVADYTSEIVYRTGQELREQFGFGGGSKPLGFSAAGVAAMPSKSGATGVSFANKM